MISSGKCGNDGFYYNDESSIVICSNGNAHIQPCAPGSKNSPREEYLQGNAYAYKDFCDVNLVNDGYIVKHGHADKSDYAPPPPPPKEFSKVHEARKFESKIYHGKYEGKVTV